MSVEAPSRTRRRRPYRWRTPITLLVLLAILIGATVWGWRALRGPDPARASTTCTTVKRLTARDVKLNVYNATSHSGLATKTSASLRARGFRILTVANFDSKYHVRGVALVRAGPKSKRAVLIVRRQLPSSNVQLDDRRDGTVDLILGRKFRHLAKLSTSKPKAVRICRRAS